MLVQTTAGLDIFEPLGGSDTICFVSVRKTYITAVSSSCRVDL